MTAAGGSNEVKIWDRQFVIKEMRLSSLIHNMLVSEHFNYVF